MGNTNKYEYWAIKQKDGSLAKHWNEDVPYLCTKKIYDTGIEVGLEKGEEWVRVKVVEVKK